MFAASLLVVAVMATYASLAVISLTAGGSLSLPTSLLPGSLSNSLDIHWNAPNVKHLVNARSPETGHVSPLADITLFDFGPLPTVGSTTRQLSITNPGSTTLPLYVTVTGGSGVSATFHTNGRQTMSVHPKQAATIDLTSNPLVAGPITGKLQISIVGSNATAYTIQLAGSQPPLPAAGLTATPAKGGAVDLAWTSSPSSGVTGYVVQRSTGAAGTWQTVASLPGAATTFVDKTPADATYAYQVFAVAPGATPGAAPVESGPGPQATAAADSAPPAEPTDVGAPPYINADMAANGGGPTIPVSLIGSSSSDTITVTLTDKNGKSVSGQHLGGASTVNVNVPNVGILAEGKITVSATATDSLGNTSPAFTGGPSIWKDTNPPAAQTVSVEGDITSLNDTQYPVTVNTEAAAAGGATVTANISDGTTTATQPQNENAGDTSIIIPVDASKLADGTELVATATVTDEAGNQSQASPPVPVTKDSTPPPLPTSIGVVAGPNNPAGVVTAGSESAVTVQATFDQPPSPNDQFVMWVAGTPYNITPDGQSTTLTVGPLDLTSLPDGTYKLGIKETDPDGNVSKQWSWHFVKDTGGAEAPNSVGVPAGPNNPAGYVNAATQTAATIVATFAGPTDPADQISISVGGLDLPAQPGGSDQLSWTADLSSLPDGTLPITGTIVDGNGVTTTFTGSLIKDTQPPPAPAVAYVVGPPPNTIKQNDASCVKVFVAFNQAPDPSDLVTVALSDGTTTVTGSASAGDGHVVVGCIDASSLSAGTISVNVTVTDVAGNSTDMTGTPATLVPCQNGGQGNGGNQGA